MKLISAKILGDNNFRSLKQNKEYVFNQSSFKDKSNSSIADIRGIAKMVFTGLNGSGKSNFMQFLAEAFSYLDSRNSPEKLRPTGGEYGFEIVYSLFLRKEISEKLKLDLKEDAYVEVKATKVFDKDRDTIKGRKVIKANKLNEYEISVKISGEKQFETIKTDQHLLLPNKIVAYSSGHNEMLSNPFYRTKFRYFLEFEENGNKGFFNDRLIYLDYSTSQFVFISNMLLSPKDKIAHIKEKIGIENLTNFRITINFNDYKRYKITLSDELEETIEKLKLCASSCFRKTKEREDVLILDFFVNLSTKKAFIFHFGSAYQLFKAFTQLQFLNLHSVAKDLRKYIHDSPKWVIFADEIAKEAPHNLPFRIERIEFDKIVAKEPVSKISRYFRSLSDGEHQFLHLIGTVMLFEEGNVLYLFDEPETHFNPQWKYDYFKLLDSVASEVDSEVLLTTHDPVLISGIKKEQLLMFNKSDSGEVNIIHPEKDIIGMGVDAILTSEIFNFNTTLDSETKNKLIERRVLLSKQVKGESLIQSEVIKLNELSEELANIDAFEITDDPLYRDIIEAIKPNEYTEYFDDFLSPERKEKRKIIAENILKRIQKK